MKLGYVMAPYFLPALSLRSAALWRNIQSQAPVRRRPLRRRQRHVVLDSGNGLANAKPMDLLQADRSEAAEEAAPASRDHRSLLKGGESGD